jgi:hypothetical protein
MLLCLLPLLTWTAMGVQYDTHCNVCGHDNPQWLVEDSVHYCENCGALGYPAIIEDKTASESPGTEGDADDPPSYGSDGDEEIPIAVVVGGAAAVTAVAVAMARAKKKKGKGKPGVHNQPVPPNRQSGPVPPNRRRSPEPEPERPAGYILQLSQDRVVLSEGMEASVVIRVLKVMANGQTTLAPQAEIRLQQQGNSNLLLLPAGMGAEMQLRLQPKGGIRQQAEEQIHVTANVPGNMVAAVLTVSLHAGWQMVFR